MEMKSRRRFMVDSAKLAGGLVGASTLGTGLLSPLPLNAGEIELPVSSFKQAEDLGKRILVAYNSDYGSTGEVAVTIGKTIYEAGNSVDVRAIRDIHNLQNYDAVIIGSPIQYDK